MTTSRIVRGTKARVFLYICAVVIIIGIIACYNNTLTQLESVRQSSEICHQQEENLSTQLQVISDYKQRLENTLKTEKANHQQAKLDLEKQLKEVKLKYANALSEAKTSLSSSQQHLNLLQTQHDDYKAECIAKQTKLSTEIGKLSTQLKETQDEATVVAKSKESLKSQYLQLEVDKENLEKQLNSNLNADGENASKYNHLEKKNHELQREIDSLKQQCNLDSVRFLRQNASSPSNLEPPLQNVAVNNFLARPDDFGDNNNNINQAVQSSSNKQFIEIPSKSTTSSGLKVSLGSLNGARPLRLPTVTPNSKQMLPVPLPYNKKLPAGVVRLPKLPAEDQNIFEEKNELPIGGNDNGNKNGAVENVVKKADENVANEIMDQPAHAAHEDLGFGDFNDPNNKENVEEKDGNEIQLDENDADGGDNLEYDDSVGKIKELAIRN